MLWLCLGEGISWPRANFYSDPNHATEFRAFLNQTEDSLWEMFESIDRNHNGEIDKAELRNAFSRSGVTVSSAKLDRFFAEVDKNNDGVISYTEWRYDHLGLR